MRGVAVVTMVVDHVCACFGTGQLVRLTVGRLALPLFMLCSGWLLARRPPTARRLYELAAAAVAATVVVNVGGLSIGQPDVLWLILVGLLLAPAIRRWPVASACVGLVQASAWPMHSPIWTGYEPGLVVALLALGVLWGRYYGLRDLERWPAPAALQLVGRYPLSIYVAHLAALAVAVNR